MTQLTIFDSINESCHAWGKAAHQIDFIVERPEFETTLRKQYGEIFSSENIDQLYTTYLDAAYHG